uniref:Uncharacterized protein n=1 Tax=Timema tahoe TaxID=61484 RepID=A0A7R9IH11_9NEOP|nr:unnamed protein product [Timema tahoe]
MGGQIMKNVQTISSNEMENQDEVENSAARLEKANGWKEESSPLFLGLSLAGSAQSVYCSLTDTALSRYRKTNERLTTFAIDL